MDWHAGTIPLIELAAYYGWLPPESQTRTALAGDLQDRRWTERDWMQATEITYLQTLMRIMWIGLRIQGKPPKTSPIETPKTARDAAADKAAEGRQRTHLARVAQLRKYSPTYQQQAG